VYAVTAASNSESSSISSLQNQGRQLAFEETEVVEVGENEGPKPVKKKAGRPKKVPVDRDNGPPPPTWWSPTEIGPCIIVLLVRAL
jgi:hypothetical protein